MKPTVFTQDKVTPGGKARYTTKGGDVSGSVYLSATVAGEMGEQIAVEVKPA